MVDTQTDLPDHFEHLGVGVADASVSGGFRLLVRFTDGHEGAVDFRPLLLRGLLRELLDDEEKFLDFSIDEDLRTIVWGNGADLAPSMLRSRAVPDETYDG